MDNRTEIKFFLQKMRVGFITNSHCDDLLNMSINLYKDIAPEIINIDGSKGLYGYNVFNNILSDERLQKQFDYLIYIDEDCFISNIYELYETIKFLINNDYWFAGMPDGGVISHRFHNPVSINTFFTFFNLKKIKEIYKINCASNVVFEESLKKFAPLELFKSYIPYPNEKRIKIVLQEGYKPYGINYDNFEPYYKIFFYLLKNGAKPFYLNGDDAPEMDGDGATTKLYGINNKIFCYHTWFARAFKTDHNQRIKHVYSQILKISKIYSE